MSCTNEWEGFKKIGPGMYSPIRKVQWKISREAIEEFRKLTYPDYATQPDRDHDWKEDGF